MGVRDNAPVPVPQHLLDRQHPHCPSCRKDMQGVRIGGGVVEGAPHLTIITFRTACCDLALNSQIVPTSMVSLSVELTPEQAEALAKAKAEAMSPAPTPAFRIGKRGGS